MVKKIAVLGLGNQLMGDDGVGIDVVRKLKELTLPPSVEAYEVGTPGLHLISFIEEFDKVVLVDALRLRGPPGTVYRLTLNEVLHENLNVTNATSMHEIDATVALDIAKHTGRLAGDVVFIGIEPKRVELDDKLSFEVNSAVSTAVKLIIKELEHFEA